MKILLMLFGLTFFSCKKEGKYCYECHQGFSATGIPPRDFDTCFNSESDYNNHKWMDNQGNDLTITCNQK